MPGASKDYQGVPDSYLIRMTQKTPWRGTRRGTMPQSRVLNLDPIELQLSPGVHAGYEALLSSQKFPWDPFRYRQDSIKALPPRRHF
jgi:hypothetical protein